MDESKKNQKIIRFHGSIWINWNCHGTMGSGSLGSDGDGNLQADQSGLNRVLAAAQKLQTQACCHLVHFGALAHLTESDSR